jgi:hypothetical protein
LKGPGESRPIAGCEPGFNDIALLTPKAATYLCGKAGREVDEPMDIEICKKS